MSSPLDRGHNGRTVQGVGPSDGAGQRLFGIDELGLGFDQRRGDSANRLTRALHGCPPPRGDQS